MADDGAGPDEPARGLPPSPAQVEAPAVRSPHQKRAGALRTWADGPPQRDRRQEVTAAGGQGEDTQSLWVVLVVGGVITVSFTYLFGLKSNVAHALMVAALTLLICGVLFTIAEFNNSFSGPVEIQPEAFREVLRSFGGT